MRVGILLLLIALGACESKSKSKSESRSKPKRKVEAKAKAKAESQVRKATADVGVKGDVGTQPKAKAKAKVKVATAKVAVAKVGGAVVWDRLLRKYCRAGRVGYSRMAKEAKGELQQVVAWVGARAPGGSRASRLAFYLNAYNALVVNAIVARSPGFRGVMTVPGFFKALRHRVAGRTMTLDQLENSLIRPTFKEPRVHFALVCGAQSCPPLRCRAFTAAGLETTLEGLARAFINSARGVVLPPTKNAPPRVSSLFKWYAADFTAAAGSVAKYLAKYHGKASQRITAATRLDYLPYSWRLNGE
ncbi:MAG: DUF547 domain-containing protein [Myxococcales bacterium]|nr:DUF547 domain-containing protein [Myxococcales bacterium]